MSASMITVSELIKKLSMFPGDRLVVIPCPDWELGEGQLDGACSVFPIQGYETRSGWNVSDAHGNGPEWASDLIVITDGSTAQCLADDCDDEIDKHRVNARRTNDIRTSPHLEG
jgi:hypothetical protein